jgi:hypothetical protein
MSVTGAAATRVVDRLTALGEAWWRYDVDAIAAECPRFLGGGPG